jgi:hypothetical protein
MRRRFFIDTEFIERGPDYPITLLSLGMVDETGRTLYLVNADADLSMAGPWVQQHVIPNLKIDATGEFTPRGEYTTYFDCHFAEMGQRIFDFVDGGWKPEFWGYYVSYDWVAFCQIFGTMMGMPSGWPMYCGDVKQFCKMLGDPKLPSQATLEHHALNDAIWNKQAFEFLVERARLRHIEL